MLNSKVMVVNKVEDKIVVKKIGRLKEEALNRVMDEAKKNTLSNF